MVVSEHQIGRVRCSRSETLPGKPTWKDDTVDVAGGITRDEGEAVVNEETASDCSIRIRQHYQAFHQGKKLRIGQE